MKFYIVGNGILGLACAEYFSRFNKNITIISDHNPLSGSLAAAANLATKGQLFGRDPHFQMKLDAKKIYSSWVSGLISEIGYTTSCEIFKMGTGLDIFSNTHDRDRHLKRVLQSKNELLQRQCSFDSILAHEENCILYKEEAWVHAASLLNILKKVLQKRGVEFISQKFNLEKWNSISNSQEKTSIIFCTGAWTKQLLLDLKLNLPTGFEKTERLSLGATYALQNNNSHLFQKYVLYEKISSEFKNKVTLSGNSIHQYVSSTSIKIKTFDCNIGMSLEQKKELEFQKHALLNLLPTDVTQQTFTEQIGLRVGYGHNEILIEPLHSGQKNISALVCCGAHKSGYLFAPVVGKKIEAFL